MIILLSISSAMHSIPNAQTPDAVVATIQIKKDIEQPKPYTQTTAWLSLKTNRELLDTLFPAHIKEPYKSIIEKAIDKEETYRQSHYVFYFTLTPAVKIIRDLYTNLYQKKHALSDRENVPVPGFPFLLLQTMDKKSFYDLYTDTQVQSVVNAKITTNVSLFSNIESKKTAVNYFVHTPHKTQLEPWFFDFIATQLMLPQNSITASIPKLQELYNTYCMHTALTNNNILLQIFIPKEQVMVPTSYITMRGVTFSWDPGIIVKILLDKATTGAIAGLAGEALLTNAFERLVWVPDVLGQNTNVTSKPYQQFKHAVDKDLEETDAFRTAPFLQAFMTTPYIIAHNNNAIEAKILFPIRAVTIEPQKNIVFFEYSTLPETQKVEYNKKIQAIAEHSISTTEQQITNTSQQDQVTEEYSTEHTNIQLRGKEQKIPKDTKATIMQEHKKEQEKMRAELKAMRQKIKEDMRTMHQSIQK